MEIRNIIRSLTMLAVLGWASHSPIVKAETTNCTNIVSVPTVISTQGVYCLKQHIQTSLASGAAITITTNNVTIDCNHFKLGNLASGPTTNAAGMSASGRLNVTIRNCGIRGFRVGVQLVDGDYRVEDNVFDLNTQTAISVDGDGSAVKNNEIIDTGNSLLPGLTQFFGIYAIGDVDVINNNVSSVAATAGGNGTAYGIFTQGMDAGAIKGNRVRNLSSAGSGARRGIWNADGNRNTVEDNTVVMSGGLLGGDAGIRCGDGLILSGASRNNTVLGTGLVGSALAFLNCTSVAGDYVNPL